MIDPSNEMKYISNLCSIAFATKKNIFPITGQRLLAYFFQTASFSYKFMRENNKLNYFELAPSK